MRPPLRWVHRLRGPGAVTSNMSATLRNTDTARMTLLEVGHAPTEMVLTRLCGDVAKVTYNLRLNGDIVTDSQLGAHDQSLRRSLEAILGGEVTDAAWTQATVGVRQGGLGLREARGIALSAFLASRIASRPHVQELAQHMQDVGLAPVAVVMRAFDQRTDDALTQLVGELDSEIGTALVDQLTDLASTAQLQWDALFDESASQPSEASARRLRRPGAAAGLVPNDEDGDDEHPDAGTPTTAMHIQKVIYAAVDSRRSAELLQALREEGDVSSLRRLEELNHAETDHSWLWALSKHRGPVLRPDQYVEAVRVRLGIAGPSEPVPCHLCGVAMLDTAGAHAHCCSRAESTRGHNCVARFVFDIAAQCDPSTELEAAGLIPGTRLRPADVLTGALGSGLKALDVGIASPDAANAGDDCTVSMYARKVETYAPYAAILDQQNITYQPVVWSAYGRPHPQTTVVLRTLATRLARRRGCSDAEWRYKRLRAAVGVEIWRRAAKMVQSCWPGGGESDGEPGCYEPPGSAAGRPLARR